jgi:thiol-disulfide isomerase/thioredoxin
MLTTLLASIVLTLPAAPAMHAQDAAKPAAAKADAKPERLMPGMAAPKLDVKEFIKGSAIDGFKAGQVYVVEFWATWCGPCIRAFPHLSELQKEYGDKVTIIGVNIWERPYDDGTLAKVKETVEKQGDKMAYTVAYDGPDAKTDKAWMAAAGRNGIPSAFIVDQKGMVAWMGHPMQMDPVLAKVVAGNWNPEEAKKLAEAEAKEAEAARALQKASRDLLKARVAARESGDWSGWSKTIDGLIESTKGTPNQMQFRMMKFQTLIGEANMPEPGYELGSQLVAEGKGDAQLLNAIAWFAVQDDSVMKRNLDFCLKAAQAANEATKGEDGAVLDTLARVHWERGENAKAIELQEKAVSLSKDTPMAKEMQESLETYKKGK